MAKKLTKCCFCHCLADHEGAGNSDTGEILCESCVIELYTMITEAIDKEKE